MDTHTLSNPARLSETVADGADHGINSARPLPPGPALDHLAGTVQDVSGQVAPLLTRAVEEAGTLAQRGVDRVRETSLRLREGAQHASDRTLDYIRAEPVKATLIAAAAGAALMGLVALLSRSRN